MLFKSFSRSGGPSFLACVPGVSVCGRFLLCWRRVCVRHVCVELLCPGAGVGPLSALRWLSSGLGFLAVRASRFFLVGLSRKTHGGCSRDGSPLGEGWVSLGQGWRLAWLDQPSRSYALEMPSLRPGRDGRLCRYDLGRSPGELNGIAYSLLLMLHSGVQLIATVANILAHVLHRQHGFLSFRTTTSFHTSFGVLRCIASSSQERSSARTARSPSNSNANRMEKTALPQLQGRSEERIAPTSFASR